MERDSESGEEWSDGEFWENKANPDLTNEQYSSLNAHIAGVVPTRKKNPRW